MKELIRDYVEKYAIQKGMEDEFEQDIKQFTLHIAEQAVEEETKNWGDPNNEMFVKRIGSNTLFRIKQLTNEE